MNYFYVFFQSQNSSIEQATSLLERYSFTVEKVGEKLKASASGFTFDISLVNDNHVLEEAKEIGQGTPFSSEMNLCNARFEVTIEDLDEALNEINTLMEVQGALQDASKGYLFLPWNESLSEPYLD